MTDRQRAFVSVLAYIIKNELLSERRKSYYVDRLSPGDNQYEFDGYWSPSIISVSDDKSNQISSSRINKDPWSTEINWSGKKGMERFKIEVSKDGRFSGMDPERMRFEGRLSSTDKVRVRDYSHNNDFDYRVS